jgi:hypothetical protein
MAQEVEAPMHANRNASPLPEGVGLSCGLCGSTGSLLDEKHRCERCVLDADTQADRLSAFEDACRAAIDTGISEQQLAAALAMRRSGRYGRLGGAESVVRVDEGEGYAYWQVEASAFLDDDDPAASTPLRRLRRHDGGWTVDELAAELQVTPTVLAMWEAGALIPVEPATALAELFGVSESYLMGGE